MPRRAARIQCRHGVRTLIVSMAAGTLNDSSDTMTLPISDWLFYLEGGTSFDRTAILSVAFLPIPNNMSDTTWVF